MLTNGTLSKLRDSLQDIESGASKANELRLHDVLRELHEVGQISNNGTDSVQNSTSQLYATLKSCEKANASVKSAKKLRKRSHPTIRNQISPAPELPFINIPQKIKKRKERHVKSVKHMDNVTKSVSPKHMQSRPRQKLNPIGAIEFENSLVAKHKMLQKCKYDMENFENKANKTLSIAKEVIPLRFLFEHNLSEFCQEKGIAIIDNTMTKMLRNYLREGIRLWKEYIELKREEEINFCAFLLCRVIRGHLARCRFEREIIALKKKQSIEQQHIQETVSWRHKNAIKIQSCYRCFVWRTTSRKLREYCAAVIIIQRAYRHAHSNVMLLAASLAKAERELQATRIQACFRGYRVRIQHATVLRDIKIENRAKDLLDPEKVIAANFVMNGAAIVLQRNARCWLCKKRGKLLLICYVRSNAVRKIQHAMRCYICRKQFRKCLYTLRLDNTKRQAAATIIQSLIRGCRCRWRYFVEVEIRNIEKWQSRMQEKQKRLRKRTAFSLAIPSQGINKVSMLLTASKQLTPVVASIRIQTAWRGYKSRKSYTLMKNRLHMLAVFQRKKVILYAAMTIQRAFCRRRNLHRFREKTRYSSSILIQAYWRGYTCRKRMHSRLLRRRAAVKLQRFYRYSFARNFKKFIRERRKLEFEAATTIQRAIRCYASKTIYCELLVKHRANDERRVAGAAYLAVCEQHLADFLIIQSFHGEYLPNEQSHQGQQFSSNAIMFPVMQLIFLKFCSRADRKTSRKYSALETSRNKKKKVELDHSRFIKIFRESKDFFNASCTTQKVDLIVSRLRSKRGGLSYDAYIEAFKCVAAVRYPSVGQVRSYYEHEAQLLTVITENLLQSSYWENALKVPLHNYSYSWITHACITVQRFFRGIQGRNTARFYQELLYVKLQNIAMRNSAVMLQKIFRRRAAEKKLADAMKSVFRKYIDADSGMPFWLNPLTGFSTWQKPVCFGDDDVHQEIITLPDKDSMYSVSCNYCQTASANTWCISCEDFFCSACFDSFHSKGNNLAHDWASIDLCVICGFQVASNYCPECVEFYCDGCTRTSHDNGVLSCHRLEDLMPKCEQCEVRRAVRSYCHTCYVSVCHVCSKFHEPQFCYVEDVPLMTKKMERRIEEVRIAQLQDPVNIAKVKEKKHRNAAATRIQRGWRRKIVTQPYVDSFEKIKILKQEQWNLQAYDEKVKKSFLYGAKNFFGAAQVLATDTKEDITIKRLNAVTRKRLEVLAKKNNTTIHDIVRFGIPLAGYLSVVKGKDKIQTTFDLSSILRPGQTIRIDGNTYRINPKLIVRNDCFCLNSPYMSETNSEIKGYSVEVDAHEVDFQDLNTAQRIDDELKQLKALANTTGSSDVTHQVENWQELVDPTSGCLYYYNTETGESRWEPPE